MAQLADRPAMRRSLGLSKGFNVSQRQLTWGLVLPIAAVALLGVVALAAVRFTGGSPNPLNHLGYPGIILAAYLFGWRGAVISAAYTAFLLGPFPALAGLSGGLEGPEAWAIRASMFLLVGAVTGLLFTHMRHAMDEWRAAADEVAQGRRDSIIALARGAEAKDQDTGEHVNRVGSSAEALARSVGMSTEAVDSIALAAVLHDVGKLRVPDRILMKPAALDEAEWAIMRQHPVWGEQILADGIGFGLARRIARWHHENFDGSGYPDRLSGNAIPLEARIVRIADAYDAMTHDRPYRPARPVDWALEEIERCAGRDFDPELARVFVSILVRP
jgi:HD-GYP domain-containing protein (c-di-GMP phosphodiesterase class II)